MKPTHLLALAAALSACADDPVDVSWVPVAGATCGARTRRFEALDSPHVDPAAGPIAWNSNPPSSGPHAGAWARFGVFSTPLPRAHYVHNLEHGGVVIAYRCADDRCPLAARVRAVFDALPADPSCVAPGAPSRPRAILTPDPLLESEVAAAAWGVVYQSDCVDGPSLAAFYTSRVGMAPEDTCADGAYR